MSHRQHRQGVGILSTESSPTHAEPYRFRFFLPRMLRHEAVAKSIKSAECCGVAPSGFLLHRCNAFPGIDDRRLGPGCIPISIISFPLYTQPVLCGILSICRRGAGVDDQGCLLSSCPGNGTVGSNPTLSATPNSHPLRGLTADPHTLTLVPIESRIHGWTIVESHLLQRSPFLLIHIR